jgi:hypothetical protein
MVYCQSDNPRTLNGHFMDMQQRHWHDHALVWSTAAAALAAALAAGSAFYQAYLTRQNNVVSQRAFVYVDNPLMSLGFDPSRNKVLALQPQLINSGNTPTKDLELFIRCLPTVERLADPFVLFQKSSAQRVPQVIGPRQTVRAICAVPLEHIERMAAGRAFVYLMGEITYRDRLGDNVLHVTRFSYEMRDVTIAKPEVPAGTNASEVLPVISANFVPYGLQNCTDEDCGRLP